MNNLTIFPIRSGSSGNATLISDGATHLLVDCGISGKAAAEGLLAAGVAPSEVAAMLITHEHSDHIKGVGVFSRKYGVPIYARRDTLEAMPEVVGKISPESIHIIESDFSLGNIRIKPFDIPHDAANPTGYVFENDIDKAAVATDIGEITETVLNAVRGSRCVLLEANYDPNMLDMGSYPYALKQRIKSERGHLCNEEAGIFAAALAKSGTREIILGHLSRENNYPALAFATVKNVLREVKITQEHDVALSVAERDKPGCICFDGELAEVCSSAE